MLDLCGPNLDDETQFQMAIRASLEEPPTNHVGNTNGQSKHSSKSPKKFGIVHSPEKTTTLFVQVRKPKIVRKNNSRRSQSSRLQQPMGEVTS